MQEVLARRIAGESFGRTRSPSPPYVPLALRSASHQRVTRGRFPPIIGRPMALIKWVIDGEAAIGVEGRRLRFARGEVAIRVPSTPHQFWALSDTCELCWFSIDGPAVEEFVLGLGIRAGVYTYGDPPVAKIEEMMRAIRDITTTGQRAASLLGIRMLYDVADRISNTEVPSVVHQAQQVIHAEFADADLSVDRIASKLHYHRGSLSRVFHKYTGVTIINYITQVRLQHARTLLMHTEDRVGDIANKCGFREPNYFCRWVHKHTGTPPSRLRRESVA